MKKFSLIGMAIGTLLFMGWSTPVIADTNDTKVTGEVIDTFCYMSMGAKGESHRQCGIKCAKKGIPVALLENGTGDVYILLPNKDATPLPDGVISKMGRIATITGHVYSKGGSKFMTVESVG